MRTNVFAIGDREIGGEIHRILCIGNVTGQEANINRVYSIGNVSIEKGRLGKGRTIGDLQFTEVQIGSLKAIGTVRCLGVCGAKALCVTGNLEAQYLECSILSFGGSGETLNDMSFTGVVKTQTLEILNTTALNGELECRNMIIAAPVWFPKEAACEHFFAFAPVNSPVVNGETVFLYPFADTKIEGIYGSRIVVEPRFPSDMGFEKIPKTHSIRSYRKRPVPNKGLAQIDEIEGDRVALERVRAKLVSGTDITIGDMCVVDRVVCRGSLTISERAVVGETVREA